MNTVTISPVMIYLIERLDTLRGLSLALMIISAVIMLILLLNYFDDETNYVLKLSEESCSFNMGSVRRDLDSLVEFVESAGRAKQESLELLKMPHTIKILNSCEEHLSIISSKFENLINCHKRQHHNNVMSIAVSLCTTLFLLALFLLIPSTKSAYSIYIHYLAPTNIDSVALQNYLDNVRLMIESISR